MSEIIDIKHLLIKRLIDAIAELDAAMPRWIRVKDQLPPNNKLVLTYDGKDIEIRAIDDNTLWKSVYSLVTHWMLFPMPPEENE